MARLRSLEKVQRASVLRGDISSPSEERSLHADEPNRFAALPGARRARPASDCNSLRAGAFATPLHLHDLKFGLPWRSRTGEITGVLDRVLFQSKTRQRPREPRLVDMPSRVIALLNGINALLHGKLRRRHV